MTDHKIIITGPVGAGKTTAIHTISDIAPVKTEAVPSDGIKKQNNQTTVAMDYGMMRTNAGDKIHIYGTPGQERFDFMWEILSTGGMGLVILLDNTRENPFQDMHFFLKSFKQHMPTAKIAIGITQMDRNEKPELSDYSAQFSDPSDQPAIFAVDARVKSDVLQLIHTILE
ncbi:MAG: ATP/GTP-binding protein [Verrucomicrobiales bacterium]|nr:ATP/GTP-binding protein [Verrucomicrobiales bacterium]